MITKDYVGAMCREFRRLVLKKNQTEVANEIGCCRATVNRFENGNNTSYECFFYYIRQGLFDWIPADKWKGWYF